MESSSVYSRKVKGVSEALALIENEGKHYTLNQLIMRDKLKDKEYFEEYLKSSLERHQRGLEKLKSGSVNEDRIIPAQLNQLDSLIKRIGAFYSSGLPIEDMKTILFEAIDLCSEYWAGNRKFVGPRNKELNQYGLFHYDEILWMLSIGFLLKIPNAQFLELVGTIDQDHIKDKLFEFIISAKIPSRHKLDQESYQYGMLLFGKLRDALDQEDKIKAEQLVKNFLEKDWYKEHKDTGWYNSHNSKFNIYAGYWCFEAAAVVAIMELDDSSFRDNQYYPKDLVDYYRSELV